MFNDRHQAGRELAAGLVLYKGRGDAVVMAIPRGGVVIGAVLAKELGLPLDVVLAKKIGHPENPEYAIGAVDLNGEWVDENVLERDGVPGSYVAAEAARVRAFLKERDRLYHARRPPVDPRSKTVILCDDGVATGDTMAAAIRLARRRGAGKIVAAAPVGSQDGLAALQSLADEVVCILKPESFAAIGQFYRDFKAVEEEEAIRLLEGTLS